MFSSMYATRDIFSSMYATSAIFSNISKGPQYLAANYGKLPNLRDLLFAFTFKNTCSPILKYLNTILFSAYILFKSSKALKLCLIFFICSSISFNKVGLTSALSVGLSQLTDVLHFPPYNVSNGLIFNEVLYPLL